MKKTYKEILNSAEDMLTSAGIAEAASDAWILFEYTFDMNRTKYLTQMMSFVSEEDEEKYMHNIRIRQKRVPVQHITNSQCFMGFDFFVNEHVLIPRFDTEILVDAVVNTVMNQNSKVLDMCTGSGCIALSIAKLCHGVMVDAVDVSEEAIKVANNNKARLKVHNCNIIYSDLFENITDTYDVIVSNPPYIESDVIFTLEPEVKDFEPLIALDGDEDGLKFYRIITNSAASRLNAGGCLFYEIGYNQAEAVEKMMKDAGFNDIRTIKDMSGLDRVVTGRK